MHTYLFLAVLAFAPPTVAPQSAPAVAPDALLQLAVEEPNIFAHLAGIILVDGNLDECCPNVDVAIVEAFKSAEEDLFIFTGDGDDEMLQVLQLDDGMFNVVFEAYLLDMQFNGVRDVTGLVEDGNDDLLSVHCVLIDNNTILCAWDNPKRIIILCRVGNEWRVCFDSNKGKKKLDLR